MKSNIEMISGNIVDVLRAEIYPGTLRVGDGRIVDIVREHNKYRSYIIPGFIDAHVHIESSMLAPSEFARAAVVHGTVATVSDPHEIANVMGVDGVRYMTRNAAVVPLKFYFGAPSCVPASAFETSGAVIGPGEVEELLRLEEIKYLGEVMNFPGVLSGDSDITNKINIAKKLSKPIDGHAPGLRGKELEKYVKSGISTDHECLSKDEALEKIRLGMKVQIREGSAARNFDEFISLVDDHHESCMFCSDDKHPDDLVEGHINDLVRRALQCGFDLMKVLRVACVNPVLHYKLDVGLLRRGDYADFLVVDNLDDFGVLKTYIAGEIVAEEGKPLIFRKPPEVVNNFRVGTRRITDFALQYKAGSIKVIEAIDGQLITSKLVVSPRVLDGYVVSDIERDILKMVVVNRYKEAPAAIGFVKNFGLRKGAIASSVAHDSHNVIAVGTTDEDICRAVNSVIENRGGISATGESEQMVLPLPVAGIMSNQDYTQVAEKYASINSMAKSLGSMLRAPFMTLSFMALLVIPELKLSDQGLFDGENFEFVNVFKKPRT